jgi:hypothetical protein
LTRLPPACREARLVARREETTTALPQGTQRTQRKQPRRSPSWATVRVFLLKAAAGALAT